MSDLVPRETEALAPIPTTTSGRLVSPGEQGLAVPEPPRRGYRPGRLSIAVIAAAIVAAVAIGAAAFSGGSTPSAAAPSTPDGAAQGSLAASASNSSSAQTVAFTVSATETSPGTHTTLLTGSGAFDLSKHVGQLTATVPALSSMTGGGNGTGLTVVSDGTNVYLKAPELSSLTGGKSWVEASIPDAGSLGGGSGSTLPLSMLANPTKALGMLGSLGTPVTKVGTVQLNGASTTEYQTTISVAAMAAKLSQQDQNSKASDAAAKALQQLGVPTIPVTIWVGADGYLRQVTVSVDLSHATIGGVLGILHPSSTSSSTPAGSTVSVTVGLSNYGQPVSVSVPPASDTTNLSGMFSSVKGAFSKAGSVISGIASHV